jgi:hypothetical protein
LKILETYEVEGEVLDVKKAYGELVGDEVKVNLDARPILSIHRLKTTMVEARSLQLFLEVYLKGS